MGAVRVGRDLEWERVIVYRFAHGRTAEITNFDYGVPAVDAFFQT
jgi:hypothetical protein